MPNPACSVFGSAVREVPSWLIAYRLPWSDKVRLQKVSAGDSAALLTFVSDLREKGAVPPGKIGAPDGQRRSGGSVVWMKPGHFVEAD